ncbi:MAG: CcmD family protein [Sediminibacterium sp.]|nr:MAG: CcmD family protein [Sediminibacterium sp.]
MQIIANAQTAVTAAPATDFMRSNGKIYLVMTIVVVIMTGLLLYVISIDRKISQLEKK